ncbi:MAG: hypothetical protein ISS34_03895 [Candidatus Omnitrophica bacterium]|nr:hypothetical protein [Candidatus Omnitrophota bacterium]
MKLKIETVIVSVFAFFLLVPSSAYALRPLGTKSVDAESKKVVSQEGAAEEISAKDVSGMKRRIAEEIEKTKEEKRKIIEKVKKEGPPAVRKRRPFEAVEGVRYTARPEPKIIEPTQRHNVLIKERPFVVILTLLALAGIAYLLYRLILRRMSK